MKSLVPKLFVFLLFFIVEVDIRAQMNSWPKDCDFERPGCTLGTENAGEWMTVKSSGFEIRISPNSALSRRSEDRVHLVDGMAIFINNGPAPLQVSFPSGAVRLMDGHEVFLQVSSERVQIHAPRSKVEVLDKDGSFDLLPGLMVDRSLSHLPSWWGVPRAFSFESLLEVRMKAGLIHNEAEAVELAKQWREASKVASILSRHLVERTVASERQKEEERQKKHAQAQQEQQRLRALFYQKNFLDQ